MTDYRTKCLEAKGEQCEICDTVENIIAYHIDGDRSNNTLENLMPVCESCHRRFTPVLRGTKSGLAGCQKSHVYIQIRGRYEKNGRGGPYTSQRSISTTSKTRASCWTSALIATSRWIVTSNRH